MEMLKTEERSVTRDSALPSNGSYPPPDTLRRTYDDTDLSRAVAAYRFFYPTVSGLAQWKGQLKAGLVPNAIFAVLDIQPRHVGFTLNSDTCYGMIPLDLRAGPVVLEVPPGPLMVVATDVNQRWVADMGLPGPDRGQGGRHLLLPPGYRSSVPAGHHVATSTTSKVLVSARALPGDSGAKGALDLIRGIKLRPLAPVASWSEPKWIDLTEKPLDITPLGLESNIGFWKVLHEAIDSEPPFDGYQAYYGEVAALGISKGQPFTPDARAVRLLEEAARIGKTALCAQSFADRRLDRMVWSDRKWEWPALRFENGDFIASTHLDLEAREKWFFQAIGASPALMRRQPGSGSLNWLATRDRRDLYLDGGKSYRLTVARPVPCQRFWSVTVYDAATRSQIQTTQGKAALRSRVELAGGDSQPADLHFGPQAPAGKEKTWIQTTPGRGWFAYLRLYSPDKAAFDGSWKPGDIEPSSV